MSFRILIPTLAAILGLHVSAARAEDHVIFASKPEIDNACRTLALRGISCKTVKASDIDAAAPGAHLWVPVDGYDLGFPLKLSKDQTTWFERASGATYFAQALIYPRVDTTGRDYYLAHLAVITREGTRDPQVVDGKDGVVWSIFDSVLRSAPPNSPEASAYLADANAAAGQAEAAQLEAQDKANAEWRYAQSPEYKRAELRKSAETCKRAIAASHRAIEQDSRIAAISGYENIAVRERAATTIVQCQDIIRQSQLADQKK
jgi:hypothetical protein